MKEACLFCKIALKEIPSQIVYENERFVAFKDIHPKAPTHLLVIPKKHLSKLYDASAEEKELLGELLLIGKELAQNSPSGEKGARFVINNGEWGGQEVDHLHLHVLAGKPL